MPRNVLYKLRNEIVASINDFGSFTSALEEDVKVRVAGFNGDLEAGDLAESYICIHNNVYIIVQYMPGPHRGIQRIAFGDYNYAVRVCMYDDWALPAVDPIVRNKAELAGNLYNPQRDFPRARQVYDIGNLRAFRKRVGHVVDLNLAGRGVAWRVEDNQADRTAFIQAVTAAMKDLLPVAERYVDNRNDMFKRHA